MHMYIWQRRNGRQRNISTDIQMKMSRKGYAGRPGAPCRPWVGDLPGKPEPETALY